MVFGKGTQRFNFSFKILAKKVELKYRIYFCAITPTSSTKINI